MTLKPILCLLATLLNLGTASTVLAAEDCRVDDPTGTPLNVRSAPNGQIVTTLQNGMRVDVLEEARIGTKRWLFVSLDGQKLGWVFGSYVVCRKSGGVPESAPNQPADQR